MKNMFARLLFAIMLIICGGATAELADHVGLPLWRKRQHKKHEAERAIELFELKRRFI